MSDKRHIKTMFPADIKRLVAFHESKATPADNDDVVVLMLDDEFLQDVERSGNKRKFLADLGFNMGKEADEIVRQKIDLGDGYEVFDRTIIESGGLKSPVGFKTVKGKGFVSILTQGNKYED